MQDPAGRQFSDRPISLCATGRSRRNPRMGSSGGKDHSTFIIKSEVTYYLFFVLLRSDRWQCDFPTLSIRKSSRPRRASHSPPSRPLCKPRGIHHSINTQPRPVAPADRSRWLGFVPGSRQWRFRDPPAPVPTAPGPAFPISARTRYADNFEPGLSTPRSPPVHPASTGSINAKSDPRRFEAFDNTQTVV